MTTVRALIMMSMMLFASDGDSFAGDVTSDPFSVEASLGLDPIWRLHANGLLRYQVNRFTVVATQTAIGHSTRSVGAIVDIPREEFSSTAFFISQRFGAGLVLDTARVENTVYLMGGPQYYRLTEEHAYPHIPEGTASVSSWTPDLGVLYTLRFGSRPVFFTTHAYLPLLLIPDNLMGASLALGIGWNF